MAAIAPKPPTAADLMTAAPRTCSTFSTVLEAVLIFRDAECGAVPVLEDGKAVGLLTDRDVALALTDHGENLLRLPVSDIMTRGVVSVGPDEPIAGITNKFSDRGVRRLLVVDGQGQLQGIISWADIASFLSAHQLGTVVNANIDQS